MTAILLNSCGWECKVHWAFCTCGSSTEHTLEVSRLKNAPETGILRFVLAIKARGTPSAYIKFWPPHSTLYILYQTSSLQCEYQSRTCAIYRAPTWSDSWWFHGSLEVLLYYKCNRGSQAWVCTSRCHLAVLDSQVLTSTLVKQNTTFWQMHQMHQ